jgi:hypothetical protein
MASKGFAEEAEAITSFVEVEVANGNRAGVPRVIAEILNALYEDSFRAGFNAGVEAVDGSGDDDTLEGE